jgi:hypothetical protein
MTYRISYDDGLAGRPAHGATGAPRSFGSNEEPPGFGAILSDLIGSILPQNAQSLDGRTEQRKTLTDTDPSGPLPMPPLLAA